VTPWNEADREKYEVTRALVALGAVAGYCERLRIFGRLYGARRGLISVSYLDDFNWIKSI